MSQLKYEHKNQNVIPNFVFEFIQKKKKTRHFRNTDWSQIFHLFSI